MLVLKSDFSVYPLQTAACYGVRAGMQSIFTFSYLLFTFFSETTFTFFLKSILYELQELVLVTVSRHLEFKIICVKECGTGSERRNECA